MARKKVRVRKRKAGVQIRRVTDKSRWWGTCKKVIDRKTKEVIAIEPTFHPPEFFAVVSRYDAARRRIKLLVAAIVLITLCGVAHAWLEHRHAAVTVQTPHENRTSIASINGE